MLVAAGWSLRHLGFPPGTWMSESAGLLTVTFRGEVIGQENEESRAIAKARNRLRSGCADTPGCDGCKWGI